MPSYRPSVAYILIAILLALVIINIMYSFIGDPRNEYAGLQSNGSVFDFMCNGYVLVIVNVVNYVKGSISRHRQILGNSVVVSSRVKDFKNRENELVRI
jgi:hypothetical protein